MADLEALTAARRQPAGDLVQPVAAGLLEEDDLSLMDSVQEHGPSAAARLPFALGSDPSPVELSGAQPGMLPRGHASNKITLGVASASRPATVSDAREGDVEVGDRASQ